MTASDRTGRAEKAIRSALIIEDEEVFAQNLKTFCELLGLDVRATHSAEQGLGLIAEKRPDLILLDYGLPGMNGLQFLGHLRQRDAALPVVMLTGHGTGPLADEAYRLGANDFLTKPVHLARLREVVDGGVWMRRRPTAPRAETVAPPAAAVPPAPAAAPGRAERRLFGFLRDRWRRKGP